MPVVPSRGRSFFCGTAARQTLARLSRKPPVQPESPCLSVVIPAFNAEKYISDCLASLFAEIVPADIEIVCIDDGSTDDTLELLNCWAKVAHNIRIVKQTNQGPGVARNVGLDVAKGEYIFFLDADDRLSSGAALLQAYEQAKADDLDVLIAAGSKISENGTLMSRYAYLRQGLVPESRVFAPDALGANLYLLAPMWPHAKLFRRNFLDEKQLRFPSLKRSEDFPMVQLALSLAGRIGVMCRTMLDHRIGVKTSLEATKDAAPLIFIEAERIFREELNRHGLSGRYRDAANAAFVVRLAYNLRCVQKYASCKAIIDHVRESCRNWTVNGDNDMLTATRSARTYVETVLSAKAIDLVQIFVDDRVKRAADAERQNAELKSRLMCRGLQTEIRALKASAAYRVGMIVTWPARKAWGGVKCLRENGIKYTVRHFVGKVVRALGFRTVAVQRGKAVSKV